MLLLGMPCFSQQANYVMKVILDNKNNTYSSKLELRYTNQSNNTVNEIFFHLYYNAFQEGSHFHKYQKKIPDADPRIRAKLEKLIDVQSDLYDINSISINGQSCKYIIQGTLLKVMLDTPLSSNETTNIAIDYKASIPEMIRRSGIDSDDGIDYTMTQWYPKVAKLDDNGWQISPYIGREYNGVFANYDIQLILPSKYTVAHTGELVNINNQNGITTHHIKAENVHDFAWSANDKYEHDIQNISDKTIHYYYQHKNLEDWKRLQLIIDKVFYYLTNQIGEYNHTKFTFAQGGDGGMEYPMITMISGERGFGSLVGTAVHEMIHSWFYGSIANDETRHAWMDEGFTTYMTYKVLEEIEFDTTRNYWKELQADYVGNYNVLMNKPSNLYASNYEYYKASYTKGAFFLAQLEDIIGEDNLMLSMKEYYRKHKNTHPTPNDFLQIVNKVSKQDLSFFFYNFIETREFIDYEITQVEENKNDYTVIIKRNGQIVVPIDIQLISEKNAKTSFTIPVWEHEVFASNDKLEADRIQSYSYNYIKFNVSKKFKSIEIGSDNYMFGDINKDNNRFVFDNKTTKIN